ncbi:MAG TPA: hypothetical protein PLP39_06295 [Flavobacterium lutivivi]|nr:hypothetical protein [Flavobacterium lutivivi]
MVEIETIERDILDCLQHIHFMNTFMLFSNEMLKVYGHNEFVNNLFASEIDNFHCMITVSQLEISLVLKSIHYSNNDYEKRHNIKKAILTTYEIKKVLDKLNPVLKIIKDKHPDLNEEFKEMVIIIKAVKKFIAENNRIKGIRDNISAHINPNFVEYNSHLKKINIEEDVDFIIKLKMILNKLNEFLYKVVISRIENKNISNNSFAL